MPSRQDYIDEYGDGYVNMSLRDAGRCVIWYCTREGMSYAERLVTLFASDNPWEEVPPRWYLEWSDAVNR